MIRLFVITLSFCAFSTCACADSYRFDFDAEIANKDGVFDFGALANNKCYLQECVKIDGIQRKCDGRSPELCYVSIGSLSTIRDTYQSVEIATNFNSANI